MIFFRLKEVKIIEAIKNYDIQKMVEINSGTDY